MRIGSLVLDDVTARHFEIAASFSDNHELGLRAGDALHLAIAATASHSFVTFDRRMAGAALQLGIPVEPI